MRLRYVAAVAGLLCAQAVHAASFPCAQAKSAPEKLICSDGVLSALDEELNAVYKRQLDAVGDKDFLRKWQRNWLKSKVAYCADVACLREAFNERIAALNALAPAASPAARWNGNYVRYWNGKPARHSADITLAGQADGTVHITGSAIWLISGSGKDMNVNIGELDGVARVDKDTLRYEDEFCKVTLRLQGGGLQAEDNYGCGGHNVTFGGEYRKQ
jgi:uncharacterized protein